MKIDWSNTKVNLEYVSSGVQDVFNPLDILKYEIVEVNYGGVDITYMKGDIYRLLFDVIVNK